ncbi:MAG TPA: TonB-dependent receptor plug domain-containing protein [Caulobacteraceae bacterium]|jgi:hypothetical protein
MIWPGKAAVATAGLVAAALDPAMAHATAPIETIPSAALVAQPSQGVVGYPAEFFAAARPATAYDMIQRLPGFTFDAGAQVRGFAGAAGNVLIDGERPTSKQDDLQQVLKRLSASQVARIDIIRGGAPGIDMQGRTLIANIVLKRGAGSSQGALTVQNKTVLDSGVNLPSERLEWSRRSDDHSFELGLNTIRYVDDGSGPGPHTEHDATGTEVYDSHLWTKAGGGQTTLTGAYEGPLAGGKFRINGLVFLDNYLDHEADRAFLPATNGDDTFKDANDTLKSELGLHYTREFGAKTTLETLAIQQLSRSHEHSLYFAFDDDEIYSIANVNAESIGRATLRYRPWPTLTVEAALEGAYNTQGTVTRYSINTVPQPLPAADEHVAETRGEAALSATWSPSARYTIETGIRLEDSSVVATGDVKASKTLFYPKPRVVFTWSPDPKDQVRIRGEREVGQLDFSAFAATGSLNVGGVHAGNPNVLPQQAWVIEGAFERRFWTSGDATVTLRRSEITDAVDRILGFDPAAGYFDEGGNVPKGSENDLIVDVTVPLDRVWLKHAQFKTTGTWRDAEVIDPTTHQQRTQTQIHPLELEAHFTQDLTKLKSSWGLDFLYGWTETYYRFNEVDIFHYGPRFGAFFEYKPTDALSIRAEASNLLSQGFVRSIAYYDGPRGGVTPPSLVDTRDQQYGPVIMLKVRQAFG